MNAIDTIVSLLSAVLALVRAKGDEAAETEALMQAEEAIKRELDRRKFARG